MSVRDEGEDECECDCECEGEDERVEPGLLVLRRGGLVLTDRNRY